MLILAHPKILRMFHSFSLMTRQDNVYLEFYTCTIQIYTLAILKITSVSNAPYLKIIHMNCLLLVHKYHPNNSKVTKLVTGKCYNILQLHLG